MAKKVRLKELVADIKADTSNWHLMQKHQLTYPQLVLAFASLAEGKLIPTRTVSDAVEAPVEVGSLAYAKSLYTMIQEKHPNIRGMKALGKRLEEAADFQAFMANYNRKLALPSKALATFAAQYPGISLHPEIRRLIWMYELSLDEILTKTASFYQRLVTVPPRLKIAADNADTFLNLSPIQANRMWHFLALKMFAENGVTGLTCMKPSDMPECDVCACVDSHNFNVNDVLKKMNRALAKGNIVPTRPFPSVIRDLDNIPPDEREKRLLKGGWYLPPFCSECQCQILPSLLE